MTETKELRHSKKVKREDFIRVYLGDYKGLMGIRSAMEFRLLIYLFNSEKWNQYDAIILYKPQKKEVAQELGVGVQSISDALSRLIKKELVIRVDRGMYKLNPKYFFKGNESARYKIISTGVDYELE